MNKQVRMHLIEERKRRQWSQQAVADQLGTTRASVNRWEQGYTTPGPYWRAKLSALFGKHEADLDLTDHPLAWDERVLSGSARAACEALEQRVPYWYVPHPRNPFFTGHENVLHRLHQILHPGQGACHDQSCALTGLGGIGKTATAIEYVYRYAHDYHAIFWISAESTETLTASFLSIAELLDLPGKQEPEHHRKVAYVLRWCASHSGWLLIFDNVEAIDVVRPFVPMVPGGSLLFTTQYPTLGLVAHYLPLEQLTAEEGRRFLLHRARLWEPPTTPSLSLANEAAANELVKVLDGLPLALEQAGAYLEEAQCHLVDYLQLFHTAPLRLLDERGTHSSHPLSVTRTVGLAFERLERSHPAAAQLLLTCAFLEASAIPEDVFLRGAEFLGPAIEQLATDLLAFQAALKALRLSSLLQRHPGTKTLSVHRLVQAVLRARLSAQEQAFWQGRLLAALCALFPEPTPEQWGRCEQLLPHVLAVVHASKMDTTPDKTEVLADMLRRAADYLRIRAQYQEAVPLYERALCLGEQVWGPDHPRIVPALSGLALLCEEQGTFQEAERLHQRAFALGTQAWGAESPEVIPLLVRLGMFYGRIVAYERAELSLQRAVRLGEQVWGPDHPHLAYSLIALATLCFLQDRDAEAERLFQRAMHLGEQVWGLEHPARGQVLNHLAVLFIKQKKWEEAEACCRQALSVGERVLGPEHPRVLVCLANLAEVFLEQGKDDQAEQLCQRILPLQEQLLGPEHPEVAETLLLLTRLAERREDLEQAAQLCHRVSLIFAQHFGQDHLETKRACDAERRLRTPPPRSHSLERVSGASETCPETQATQSFRAFVTTCCELRPGAWSRSSDIWHVYQRWAGEQQEHIPLLSRRALARQLQAFGCQAGRTNHTRLWRGIAVTSTPAVTQK